MRGKPLHQWEYAGKMPAESRDAGRDFFRCENCGFELVSYTSAPLAKQMQSLIRHNPNLKRCGTPRKEI